MVVIADIWKERSHRIGRQKIPNLAELGCSQSWVGRNCRGGRVACKISPFPGGLLSPCGWKLNHPCLGTVVVTQHCGKSDRNVDFSPFSRLPTPLIKRCYCRSIERLEPG